jgi:hypothetical protein
MIGHSDVNTGDTNKYTAKIPPTVSNLCATHMSTTSTDESSELLSVANATRTEVSKSVIGGVRQSAVPRRLIECSRIVCTTVTQVHYAELLDHATDPIRLEHCNVANVYLPAGRIYVTMFMCALPAGAVIYAPTGKVYVPTRPKVAHGSINDTGYIDKSFTIQFLLQGQLSRPRPSIDNVGMNLI